MVKKFPSQIKYERENPTITFRMKIHEKEKIQEMASRSGKSISQLVRMALLGLEKEFSVAWQKSQEQGKKEGINIGYKDGYDEGCEIGFEEAAIWFNCKKCNNRIYIEPNSQEHKKVMKIMTDNFIHTKCP